MKIIYKEVKCCGDCLHMQFYDYGDEYWCGDEYNEFIDVTENPTNMSDDEFSYFLMEKGVHPNCPLPDKEDFLNDKGLVL